MSVQVEPEGGDPAARDAGPASPARGPAYAVAGVLLAAPFVALLWVSSYARDEPRLFGFPFFYWYQLLWVFIASASTYLSYVLVRRVERPRPRLTDRGVRGDGGQVRR